MPIDVKCQTCGKIFQVNPYRAKTAKYCSKNCRNTQIQKICERCGKTFKVPNHRKTAKYCSNKCKYPKQIEKTCLYCGKLFKVKSYRKDEAIYCSRKCSYKDRENHPSPKRNKLKKTCERCGKEFEVIPYNLDRTKYCSWECRFPKDEAVCQTCGKTFKIKPSVIKKGHAKYCSIECRYSPQRVKKICKQCGEEFITTKSLIEQGGGKFCSKECSDKSKRKEAIGICETCGKPFTTQPAILKRGKRFCSLQCFAKSREQKVEKTCKYCGKKFRTRIGNIKYGYGKFCSKKCQNKYQVGPNASGWCGGVSFEPYCPKFNEEFKKRVREFWDNKCGICGRSKKENGQNLAVHHVNYEKMVCCDTIPPLFMPLCKSCHAKTNNNREWWEYMLTEYIMIWFDGESYRPK